MFSKDQKPKKGVEMLISGELNIIGVGTSITGDIRSNGDIRIDGNIVGSVTSKAKLVLGPTGKIEGDINAQNADIQGNVKGQVTVNEILYLKSTSVVNGNITTNKLVVEEGADFNGNCRTKSASRVAEEIIPGNAPRKSTAKEEQL